MDKIKKILKLKKPLSLEEVHIKSRTLEFENNLKIAFGKNAVEEFRIRVSAMRKATPMTYLECATRVYNSMMSAGESFQAATDNMKKAVSSSGTTAEKFTRAINMLYRKKPLTEDK